MGMNKHRLFQAVTLACCLLVLFLSGCGYKNPPLAPLIKGQVVAAPVDVEFKVSGETITIFWNHMVDNETAALKPEGFNVFMAKKTFEGCEGCPFEFEKAAYVAMPAMEFTTAIQQGFKYYFRIQAMDDEDRKSAYSKTVQFEFK